MKIEYQVRGEISGIRHYSTMQEALDSMQPDDWKLSYTLPCGYRVRMVLQHGIWMMRDILDEAGISKKGN